MILAIIVFILRILMLISLLSFLGWTIYTLWRDLKFQSQSLTAKKVPYISVFRENDQSEAKQIYTVPDLRIGREPACEIVVDDETVSAHHARLYFRNKQWWVEDLASTNGTYLNDERIETPTILITGDEMRVGKVLLIIEIQPLS